MCRTAWLPLAALALLVACAGAPVFAGGGSLRVGITQNFFNDMSPELIKIGLDPFGEMLRDTTGLSGEPIVGGDAFAVAEQLMGNKLQLAVFHGFEFAWVQKKHANLRPMMIAVNGEHKLGAYVLVKKDSEAKTLADLKGKEFAINLRAKEQSRLFIERRCRAEGKSIKEYFGRVVTPDNVETALDELCLGKFQAAVVDGAGMAFYKDLKPGVFARLRILAQSEAFPPPVIAYRQGGLDDKTVKVVRDGLLKAHKSDRGLEVMKSLHITEFRTVPNDFDKTLAASLAAFPSP